MKLSQCKRERINVDRLCMELEDRTSRHRLSGKKMRKKSISGFMRSICNTQVNFDPGPYSVHVMATIRVTYINRKDFQRKCTARKGDFNLNTELTIEKNQVSN